MIGLLFISISLVSSSLGGSRKGAIISFEPPDLNDWVDEVLLRDTDVTASHPNGQLVTDWKLDKYSVRLEKYCGETFEIPQITQLQWYEPQKMECKGEHYYVLKLQYDDVPIDCLRISSSDDDFAIASFHPVVIKRFYLKVYYLMTSGDCYVKYFDWPVYECSDEDHIKLSSSKCEKYFPPLSQTRDVVESSSGDDSDVTVKVVN